MVKRKSDVSSEAYFAEGGEVPCRRAATLLSATDERVRRFRLDSPTVKRAATPSMAG